MSLANLSHRNGNVTECNSGLIEEISEFGTAVNGQVVRAVHGAVGIHPEGDAQGLQHFLSGSKSFVRAGHLGKRSDVFEPTHIKGETQGELTHSGSVDQFEYFFTKSVVATKRIKRIVRQEHRSVPERQWQAQERIVQQSNSFGERFGHQKLSSFVTEGSGPGWPSSHVGSTGRRWPSRDDTILSIARSSKVANSGFDTPIAIGFDNDKRARLDQTFLPGITHPVSRIYTQEVFGFPPDSTVGVPAFNNNRHDRNIDDSLLGHQRRLAEHDPSTEVACPQCGQRFLDNGWTGFTPIYPEGYGERTWQCPACLNNLKEIRNRPMRTAGSWDPTICEHCGHPMTDPKMIGNKWMNHCTNCGKYREVATQTPLLQQQLRNWPPYPPELQSVDPGRAWMTAGKFAKLSGDLSQTLRQAMNPPPLTEATGKLPCRDCGAELVPNDDPKRTYHPDAFPPYMCPNCGRLYMESEVRPPDIVPRTWTSGKIVHAYDPDDSLINTATLLVDGGMDIAAAAQWLEDALIQRGRPPEEAQAITDEVFMRREGKHVQVISWIGHWNTP